MWYADGSLAAFLRNYAMEPVWSTKQYGHIAFHFTNGFDAQYTKWADSKKAFLLAQGYMPAQQFHVLKNPAHKDDPWYYEDEVTYPFHTPEYTFQKGSLKRLNYEIIDTAPE